ncbi:alpha/beta fold hydrolase [Actinomadura sp. 9N407]|uniref:alpha/beta fold hydrolase n=1 Tax=Actinomadura sp. 9N407 TaxID=3375154 RepID=UPI00378D1721
MNTLWDPPRFATNAGVRLAFDPPVSGGEPLLLVMGLGVSRHWWPAGLCAEFTARGFAVARYDQRDAGDSTRLPPAKTGNPISALFRKRGDAYTAEDMADDAIAVMDDLGWESAHIFGHSMGGAVAQRIALRHPARVRTVTSSAAVPSDAKGLGALKYIHLGMLAKFSRLKSFPATREGDIWAALAMGRLLASPATPFDETAAREWIDRDPSGVRDREAQSRQIGAQWHGPALETLKPPMLVLHGEDDPLIRTGAAEAIAATVEGARLVMLPAAGHDLPAHTWPTVADHVHRLTTA